MTTRIGIVSDVHASPAPLKQALEIFERENVAEIICAGDIAGYFEALDPTIELLIQADCKTIVGNHDQSWLESADASSNPESYRFLKDLPATLEFEIEQKQIFVVHAQPPAAQHGGIKLLDQNGDVNPRQRTFWRDQLADFPRDVLIVGHTHQVFAERLGDLLVLNPGSTAFNHSCMILSLPELEVQTYPLQNRDIVKCWNFSMLIAGAGNQA